MSFDVRIARLAINARKQAPIKTHWPMVSGYISAIYGVKIVINLATPLQIPYEVAIILVGNNIWFPRKIMLNELEIPNFAPRMNRERYHWLSVGTNRRASIPAIPSKKLALSRF